MIFWIGIFNMILSWGVITLLGFTMPLWLKTIVVSLMFVAIFFAELVVTNLLKSESDSSDSKEFKDPGLLDHLVGYPLAVVGVLLVTFFAGLFTPSHWAIDKFKIEMDQEVITDLVEINRNLSLSPTQTNFHFRCVQKKVREQGMGVSRGNSADDRLYGLKFDPKDPKAIAISDQCAQEGTQMFNETKINLEKKKGNYGMTDYILWLKRLYEDFNFGRDFKI